MSVCEVKTNAMRQRSVGRKRRSEAVSAGMEYQSWGVIDDFLITPRYMSVVQGFDEVSFTHEHHGVALVFPTGC
jgi:hypothetical protein